MLRRRTSFLLHLLVVLYMPSAPAAASDCSRDSTGMVPISDLGPALYQGVEGGLYPGGSNVRPAAHNDAGLAIANTIAPLDTLGMPDPTNGRIVLLSIGMSNTSAEFNAFIPRANADPAKNPRVLIVNGAIGGQSADRIASPGAAYWDSVAARLRAAGSSPLQAQVVWLKQAIASPKGGFPASADTLLWRLSTIARVIRQKFPNVRLAYASSRIYAGYATTNLNPEPYAYESGFAVKWMIANQIAGVDSLNFDPGQGPVEAPWLSWGPYLWADGMEPRSDGLTWPCGYFQSDGTHPNALGAGLVADSLLAFFKSDVTTAPWFVGTVTAAPTSVAPEAPLQVAPNPARGGVDVRFSTRSGEPWRVEIFDIQGRRVMELARGFGAGGSEALRWNATSERGVPVARGIYWIRVTRGAATSVRRVAVLGG